MLSKLKFVQFGLMQESYKVVILSKEESLNKDELIKYYINPIIKNNPKLTLDDFIALNLDFVNGKAKVNDTIKPWLTFLSETIKCELLVVTDSSYYKVLTNAKKTGHAYGTVSDCTFKGFEKIKAVLSLNYRTVFYDTKNQDKIALSNKAVAGYFDGSVLFDDIVHSACYPNDEIEIESFLDSLHQYNVLSCDIEAYSLKHYKAGIGSISFAWDKHNGGAFLVSRHCNTKHYGIYKLLKKFFYKFLIKDKKKFIWHNISYDAKILIWELLMESDHSKKEALLLGLEMFTNSFRFEDTKLIAYLATNSCAGNELGLKSLALPFAGNYALEDDDIKDISKIPTKKLLQYNLVDTLSTWYVYDTYYPKMVADGQLEIYNTILKPSVDVLMQAELHGMPINMVKVQHAKSVLSEIVNNCYTQINKNIYVKRFTEFKRCTLYHELHNKWKKKSLPLHSDSFKFEININSSNQLVELLYEMLDLPVLDKTDTGLPAAGVKTLKKLKNHTSNPIIQDILDTIIEFSSAVKILTSFIPAFEDAYYCKVSATYYLMGNFNVGGTVSGRLSCSNPNLQQIPSGSTYAKLIKDCFIAPKHKLMVGLDFNSLEDYISALTTKDPEKLKVYSDGYDGHCLRAFKYFPERLPDIVNTIESINSIKKRYEDVRQDSKAPTFALTYQGTYKTLMTNCGFDEKTAKSIENSFLDLYKVSIEYIQAKLELASQTGYVETAFGLKVRTPIIGKCLWNSRFTPYEAIAEGRTAGNALGQGYGMLNNRAAIEFKKRVLASKWKLAIWPIAHIHDAQYFIIDDNPKLVAWMNKNLVECVQWQELPEIQHDTVKLGGDLSIFYPSWKNEIVIPNGMFNPKELTEFAIVARQKQLDKEIAAI